MFLHRAPLIILLLQSDMIIAFDVKKNTKTIKRRSWHQYIAKRSSKFYCTDLS